MNWPQNKSLQQVKAMTWTATLRGKPGKGIGPIKGSKTGSP